MINETERPGNWPSNIVYLNHNIYSKKIEAATLREILPKPATTNRVCKLVRIKLITEKSHPACGQYGLFATRKLPAQSHVLDYLGYVHPETESDTSSDYDITLDSRLGIAIDAQRWGNEGRMVNDYRGIGLKPNVMFDDHFVNGEKRIGIFVLPGRQVHKGEELLVSYGKGIIIISGLLWQFSN